MAGRGGGKSPVGKEGGSWRWKAALEPEEKDAAKRAFQECGMTMADGVARFVEAVAANGAAETVARIRDGRVEGPGDGGTEPPHSASAR